MVFYHTLSQLNRVTIDFAFGAGVIVFLLALKQISAYGLKRSPHYQWLSISRNILGVLIFTMISYFINRDLKVPMIRIVKDVPSGFKTPHVPEFPNVSSILLSSVSVVLVGTIEHMAIVKSFGRLNGYNPIPSQELIAVGLGNIFGSFFGSWPVTGSFSRSAISSQSGSKSPLTAFFTSFVVLAAVYFLMPLLYYLPLSVLSGIIFVALSDLFIKAKAFKQLVQVDGIFYNL
jgi:sodium-independent sulfate anion transporter 11